MPLNYDNILNNNLVKRTYDVAIVDECDNLFLDTAKNSARIAHPSKSSFNWLYPIIYKYFIDNENNLDTKELKDIILKYENGKYKTEMAKIDDGRLKKLLKSAKIAKNKKLNLDYVIGFNEETKSKQIQIVSLDTGRIQHGSRWSNGIHELIEVKEGLEPETESNVIGSISHPTYFENYKILFGLTGTIGEEIEREEIEQIYKIKCYNIPRNFEEKLNKQKMEIYDNKKEKFNRIIQIIKENKAKRNKSQPILIILENIEETLEFGKLLKTLNYNFFTLNDIQKENEDYILNNVGHPGNILIATNAAGRGTDIIIDENSKNNGGLYVIVGFFPQNSRIEFQAIGRAGRQGNPGTSKIIVSRDEEFIYYNYIFIKKFLEEIEEDEAKMLYLCRELSIKDISRTRIDFFKKEKIYFFNLQKFFLFKEFFMILFQNNLFKYYFDTINSNFGILLNFDYYKNFALIQIDNIWSEFYSDFIKERGNKINNFDYNKDYFLSFLIKFENDWPNTTKEIYGDDYINKIGIDIVNVAIKNIKNKISTINMKLDDPDEAYEKFNDLLVNLSLSDIIK